MSTYRTTTRTRSVLIVDPYCAGAAPEADDLAALLHDVALPVQQAYRFARALREDAADWRAVRLRTADGRYLVVTFESLHGGAVAVETLDHPRATSAAPLGGETDG